MADCGDILPISFYDRDVRIVARELLGKRLVRRSRDGLVAGRIVETEAYLSQDDPACHAARGKTRRNATMFGSPGRAYVYSIHSRYCLNMVTQERGSPSAVLIRAVEPTLGLVHMRRRRQRDKLLELVRGPGRLCEAMSIDKRLDGWNVTQGRALWIEEGDAQDKEGVLASPRIGVTSAEDLLLRYFYADNRFVSASRRGIPLDV